MKTKYPDFLVLLVLLVCFHLGSARAQTNDSAPDNYAFMVAGDMRSFTGPAPAGKRYFDGVCEAIKAAGSGSFLLSPGDCDPPAPIRAAIDRSLGSNYLWYPVVGNHDADAIKDMDWFHHWAQGGIPHLVRRGPANAEFTTFSIDFGNSHLVVLDEYYDGKADNIGNGDVCDTTLAWLDQDLAATHQPLIWVTGHKPIKSFPDMDTGRVRHGTDTVTDNPEHHRRFMELLKKYHVRAYICGHTHNTSINKVEDIWQLDSGHARGAGDPGAPSTFLKVRVSGSQTWVDIYRGDTNGVQYHVARTVDLN